MRIEPIGIDSIVHVVQRGARGMEIVRDDADRFRFVRSLLYLNDTYSDPVWHQTVARLPEYARPEHWPEREPLVHILGWTLLSNHFHLLLKEIREGGTARFMQRLCGSMSMCFNKKYGEKGSIFQGSYRGKAVSENKHLNYLAFYILVKNTLEMRPGGLATAYTDFDAAWNWASNYRFSSLRDQLLNVPSFIIEDTDQLLGPIIGQGNVYKQEAKELLEFHMSSRGEEFSTDMLEPW